MRKPLENLIAEFLDEHEDATLYIRRDLLGDFEVGVSGQNHTHAKTVEEGIRRYWAGDGLAFPACAVEVERNVKDEGR